MLILIPTHGRVGRQRTYDSLAPAVRRTASLVVSEAEAPAHRARGRRVVVCPVQGNGMAAVRSWILDWCGRSKYGKVLMLDDDLTLQKRRPDLRVLGESTEAEQLEMVGWVDRTLDRYLHCAFTERNAAWADASEAREAAKGIQAVGYNVRRVLAETDCRFDRGVPPWFFIEDYHMTIQLFRAGFPNLVSRVYRVNFGPSNATGGCSPFRTPARMREAAELLERLHPGYVKAVEKETKTSFGGGVRWNVEVRWRKAYTDGVKAVNETAPA